MAQYIQRVVLESVEGLTEIVPVQYAPIVQIVEVLDTSGNIYDPTNNGQ